MFTIPFVAFLASLLWVPFVCIPSTFWLLRHRPDLYRTGYAFLATSAAFFPGCVCTCYLIEPLYRFEGESTADKVPRVMLEQPPLVAQKVRYFKNTTHESFCCTVTEKQFVEWCERRSMILGSATGDERPALARFLDYRDSIQESERADVVYQSRVRAPDGGGYEATFSRSRGMMVYEANYW